METTIDTPAKPRTVSHYTILKKLGAGGMGEVYLAEDVVLNRKVAIKFLPQDSVAHAPSRRLIREAQAAAKLVHPNICTIYEANEEPGCGFIVMEYVEGETLASRIRNKPLDMSECLEIAVQVADALTEAHSQGITHRDIKPQNIMLTGHHQAKVIDFGLARVVRDRSRIDSEGKTERLLINTESIMGTLAYMSPEQLQGKNVDARSDIFSFGVVLYEMITGHQPFAVNNTSMTISAIVSQEPPPLSDYSSDVPTELERIVRKTLRKDREKRYQTSKDLLVDLKALKHHVELEKEIDGFKRAFPSNTGDSGNRTRTSAAIQEANATTPHYLGLVKRHGTGLIIAGSILVLAIVTVILRHNFLATEKSFDTIAVLPLQNVGNDPEIEYLSDGVAESLINSLSQLPQLRVVARPTAFRYKSKEIDPQQIGRDLHVQAIITGKLTQREDMLTIQVDIVETNNGSQIWGRRYDRKTSDLLAIRQELATDITERLRLRVGSEDEKRLRTGDTRNPDAFQFYLRGLYFWNKRTAENLKKAIIEFQQAVDRDPDYGLAYVGLADSYTLLEPFAGEPSSGLIPKAKVALDRALQIDENLAEAHTSLAFIEQWSWNFSEAEREFQRAIELKPNYATGHHYYAFFLSRVRGRFNEALAEMKLAQQLDRLSPRMGTNIAQIYAALGQLDASIEEVKKVIEFDGTYAEAHRFLGVVYRKQRRYQEAIEELETAVKLSKGEGWALSDLAVCYAVSGKKAQAQSLLNSIQEKYYKREALGQELAYVHAALGQKEQAFTWLEKDFQVRSGSLFLIAYSPRGDILRETLSSDPRWNDLLRRIGLP